MAKYRLKVTGGTRRRYFTATIELFRDSIKEARKEAKEEYDEALKGDYHSGGYIHLQVKVLFWWWTVMHIDPCCYQMYED